VRYRGRLVYLGARIVLALLAISPASETALAQSATVAMQRQAAIAVARGLQIDTQPSQIEQNLSLLGSPASLPLGSTLRLVSARAGFTPGTWWLRLDCSSRRDCLPFHAVLRTADIAVHSPPGRERISLGSTSAAKLHSHTTPASLLARSGDRVDLVEELSGMRLRVKAVCLQSGGLGDRIRVQNLATHRVLLATIASKDLVRVE
jgi:hypothetical protein